MDVLTLMYMVIGLFIALWVVVLLFVKYYLDIKKWAPEARVFKEARKKKLAILEITDSAGRTAFMVGKKRRRRDIHFEGSEHGILIDPKLQGNAPENRTVDGVPIHHFSTQYPFSMSDKNARALETIIEHARANYPELNFLTDSDILILTSTPRSDLDHDVANYIAEYQPEVEREILTKKFALDTTNKLPLQLNHQLIEELNAKGIPIRYKPLDRNQIIEYLNSKYNTNLNPKKLMINRDKEGNINIIERKTKAIKATIEKIGNVCKLTVPDVINPGLEIGTMEDGNINIPDAELTPNNKEETEYILKVGTDESGEKKKYTIIHDKEEDIWTVYETEKTRVKLTKEDVVEQIAQLQQEVQTEPVKHGWFSYTYAFNNSPMGMLAQDMQQLVLLIQRMTREELKGEWERYVPLAFAVLIIVVAIIALVTVLGRGGGA